MPEELLPPPPPKKSQTTDVDNSGLLPPPPKKKSGIDTSESLNTPSAFPSTNNLPFGGTLPTFQKPMDKYSDPYGGEDAPPKKVPEKPKSTGGFVKPLPPTKDPRQITQETEMSDNTKVKPTKVDTIQFTEYEAVKGDDGIMVIKPKPVVPAATEPSLPPEQEAYQGTGEPPSYLAGIGQGAVSGVGQMVKGLAGLLATQKVMTLPNGETVTYSDKKLSDYALYKVGQTIEDFAKEYFPTTEGQNEELLGKLASGAGSMIPFIFGSVLGGAFKINAYVTPTLMGSLQNGASEYESAIANGVDEDTALKAFWSGAAIGSLEGLPIGQWAKRLNGKTGGLLDEAMKKRMRNKLGTPEAVLGALEEAGQEASTQFLNNVSAMNIYDETRGLWDGVAESGMLGGILGGTLNGITSVLTSKLEDPNLTPAEKVQVQKSLDYMNQQAKKLEGVAADDLVKLNDDSDSVKELKVQKQELEMDMASPEITPDVKEQISAKIEETDAQIAQVKQEELQAESAMVQTEGAIADLEAEKAEIESQMSTATTATQEILQPQLDAIVSDLESLREIVPQQEVTEQTQTPVGEANIHDYISSLSQDNYLFSHVTTEGNARSITEGGMSISPGTGISSTLSQLGASSVNGQITRLMNGEVVHRDTNNNSLAIISVPKAEIDAMSGKDVAEKFENWLAENGHINKEGKYAIPQEFNAGYLSGDSFITNKAAQNQQNNVKEETNDQGRTEVLTGQQEDMGVAESATPVVEDVSLTDEVNNVEGVAGQGVEVSEKPYTMDYPEWKEQASKGKMHRATGITTEEERSLESPIEIGEYNGYSPQDIAHFYDRRRGGDIAGYREYIVDAIYAGKDVPDKIIETVFSDKAMGKMKKLRDKNVKNKPKITNETNTTDGKKTAEKRNAKGVQESVQQTPAKKKIRRKGTPIHQRKIKGKRLQAVNIEPHTLREEIMQRIIGGARVIREDIVKMLGSETEAKIKMNLTAKKENGGKTIDRLAEEITAEQYNRDADGNGRYSEDEVKAELMEVLRMYDHYSAMADEIVDSRERSAEMEAEMLTMDAEEELIAALGKNPDMEAADAALDIMEMFSDEELTRMAEEKDMAFSPEIEEEISDIESDWTPWDDVPETPSTTDKLIDALEKAKIDTKNTLNAFGLLPTTYNAAIDIVIAAIKAGKAISVAIKEALDYIRSTNPENFDEKGFTDKIQSVFDKNTKPKEEVKPEPKQEKEEKPKTREKSLFKRAFEGTTNSRMKQLISEHGLDYEIESHDRAQKAAKDFVNEVGPDAALDAVRKNMIEDGAAAFVWAEIIDKVEVELQSATDPDEISRLQEYQRDLLSEFDRKARSGGRFISALQRIYRDSLFNYKADTQIQRYKDMNNGVIPAEIEQKFKDLETKLKEVNEKLKETEAKLEEEREKQAIADIKESVEREAKTKPSVKKAAKRIADKIREGKTNRPDIFMSSSPAAIVWNGALEVAAKAVEAGGSIAEALQKGLEHIRNSDWYKNLSDDTKKSAEKGFRDHINETNPKNTQVEVVGDKIRIPHELIRQKVADGITDPNQLAQSVLDEIKSEYPDLTIRQVRDAISKYGRQVNMSKEDIEVKIRKIKRLQKAISQLEDIAQGKRPLRSGLQRDPLDAEERAIQKEVKERMKELPADEETAARELKTALDAVKSRLKNAIEDIQREIDTRAKSPKKGTIEYDQEAKDLAAERDRLKALRDEILGPKTLTEEQMIDRAIKGLDRSIREMQRQIAEEDVAPKSKTQVTSPEIEERRARKRLLAAQLKTMREELGITQARQLANAKKRAQAQIDELQRRLDDRDFSKKTKKQSPTDQELNDLRAEKVRIQQEYDKEQYKNELKNRALWQKIIDGLIEIINLPRAARATAEFSPVLIQGGIQTVSQLVRNPMSVMRAFKRLGLNFVSESKAERWMDRLVASSEYPVMEQAGLSITKTDAKMTAREELYLSGLLTHMWNAMGLPLKALGKKPYEIWKAANLPAAFERAGTGYLNVLRVERFLQGMRMLEMQGKNPQDNPQDYKALAKVINTLTGRTSLGRAEMMSKVLSIALFSPRNYASVVKQTLLLPLLAEGRNKDGTMKPSVAQKIAMTDFITYMGIMTSIIAMVKFAYEDDDDPDAPKVNTDPRSSQFMTIRTGNTVVDPWHGMKQYVVLASRLISGSTVTGKGEVKELGSGPYVPTEGKLLYNTLFKYKLSPTASMVEKYLSAPRKKDEKGEYVKVDEFSKEPINVLDMTTSNLYPIYWETLMEVNKDRPADVALFLNALAFWGIGTQTYEQQVKKKKTTEYKKVD
jgi:hypothetical protein